MAMKILVIAAAGGLGRQVVLEALARGHAVSVLVRTPAKLPAALGDAAVARLAAVYTGDGARLEDVAAAAAGADAIISAGPPNPAAARALGEACKAQAATCKRAVWTAGSSNILEADGKTLHHLAFGPQVSHSKKTRNAGPPPPRTLPTQLTRDDAPSVLRRAPTSSRRTRPALRRWSRPRRPSSSGARAT